MADVPHQRSLVKQFAGKLVIVGVNSDKDRDAVRKVCAEQEITWRSFWDGGSTEGPIATRWNVRGWPTLYLIDAKGVICCKGDLLRSVSVRTGKDGKTEQFSYLDDAIEALVKEVSSAGRP